MVKKDTVIAFNNPSEIASEVTDILTEIARKGAQQMLARALEEEVAIFLDNYRSMHTEEGRQRFVRNGHLPERAVETGIGDLAIMFRKHATCLIKCLNHSKGKLRRRSMKYGCPRPKKKLKKRLMHSLNNFQ